MLAALFLLLDAWCLLASWCLNTCQTHPQKIPLVGGGGRPAAPCGGRRGPRPFLVWAGGCSSIKQQASNKQQAASIKQQALRHWALRLWQEIKKSYFSDSQFHMRIGFSLMRGGVFSNWQISEFAICYFQLPYRLFFFQYSHLFSLQY